MSRRSLSRDIHESIRQLLGKHTKILLKAPVLLELKGDKMESRILVLTQFRLFVVTAKVPARIENHFHFLDFRRIESKRSNQITFSFVGDKTYSFRPSIDGPGSGAAQGGTADASQQQAAVDNFLYTLISAARRVFPGVPVEHVLGPIEVLPPTRLLGALEWKPPDPKDVGPCGGFSTQYSCMCDYYSLPFREEVAWDVDTIYFSHDSHELGLQDFEHLDHRDLICIISAMEHNTYFRKLRASGNSSKLSADICDKILHVVGKSISLQELHVSSIGARWDFASRLAQSMSSNALCSLSTIDLSCNFIEDKGITQLATSISKLHKGMHHLNLSHCSLSNKGVSHLAQALVTNRLSVNTLTYLNLSGNTIKDDSQALCMFLAQPNQIAILDLSGTDTPSDALFGALLRGCTSALTHLNLARNPFSSKKAKDVPSTFKQFFASTLTLQYINLSHCKLPAEALKHLLLGLACNESTANVELNLSYNAFGANGATVLENCISGVTCLTRLDLSENNIDSEMSGVMQGIARNKSIISLNISKNMTGTKPKHLPAVMEAIVQLLQDEESSIQKLNLSDCKLKTEINNVINALGSNQCLQHLDISGNLMGDVGARLLAKALQINTRLKIINLDRNCISLQGYTDITYALQSNYAMRHIPFPTFDLQPVIKTHPDRADVVLHRMQELLQRNANPHKFKNTAQAFRLTQGFLLSSTQQVIDKVSAMTQDNLDAYRKICPTVDRPFEDDPAIVAEKLVREADNSKQLLSALHEVTSRGAEDIDAKLKLIAQDLTQFLVSRVQQNLDLMLSCCDLQVGQVLSQREGKLRSDILKVCKKKTQISHDFIANLVADQVGLEVHNKVNELNLIMANHISDRVIDEVIESMTAVSKTLANDIGTLKKKRSLTPDVLKGRSVSISESLEQQETISSAGDAVSQKSDPSPLQTPQTSKRVSLHGRKLRPKSEIQSFPDNELSPRSTPDLLHGSNTPVAEEEDGSFNDSPNNGEDRVTELPPTAKLQHLGKARPKRAKKHAPTRGAVITHSANSSYVTDSSIDEGVDAFYVTSFNSSAISSPSGSVNSPLLDDSSMTGGTRRGSSGSAFSHLKSSRADSREDVNSSPSRNVDQKTSDPTGSKSLKSGGGFSCLASATTDEDLPPKTSPEKRTLVSPSVGSISEIFAKSASAKFSSSSSSRQKDDSLLVKGVSPFSSRKTEAELQRHPVAEVVVDKSSPDESGKKTPEDVIKRHGIGHGNNPDLMSEMREKRASMVHQVSKQPQEDDLPLKSSEPSGGSVFGKVKLRSTGLVGNLTSPTADINPSVTSVSKDEPKGSIVGLRATKFLPSITGGTSPEPKARAATNVSSVTAAETMGPLKPKPLPKPRPWSIVGVDRKSGEMTSVLGDSHSPINENNSTGSTVTPSGNRKNTVRDLINNMNKNEPPSSGSASLSNGNSAPEPAFRRKGGSLPRGVQPPSSSSDNSPNAGKKKDSTSDDPRILKLEDDYAFDDVMDV